MNKQNALFVTGLLLLQGGLRAQVIVLQHVDVIDGTGRGLQRDQSLVLDTGRIREIGATSKLKVPNGAALVDLKGKTVMPGIIDLHTHLGLVQGLQANKQNFTRENVEAQIRVYASFGVTTVQSMGSDVQPEVTLGIRNEQREGKLEGARIFTAGRGFTAINGYPSTLPGNKGVPFEVATASEARGHVDDLAKLHVDLVKMWIDDHLGREPALSPEIYRAIIDEAHKHGIKAAAHMFYIRDAKGLLDAGVDLLAHSVRDQEVDAELIAKIKRNNATCLATLTRDQSAFVYADKPAWLDDPFFLRSGVTADTIATLKSEAYRHRVSADPDFEKSKGFYQMAQHNLKKLYDAGVRVGFGTDSGQPGRFPGYFEHWEMELMVQAGLTPLQVVQIATRNGAEFLGVSRDFGTLERGKVADLMVLDKNPLDDIRNTRTIHSVYLGGRKYQ